MSKIAQTKWVSEEANINDLKFAQYNPRKMTKNQKKDLSKSIEKFGLAEPVVVNQNNTVIGGHQRLRILIEKGIEVVKVMKSKELLDENSEKELNLRLNKNLGEWDFEMLEENFEMEMLFDVGFNENELKFDFDFSTEDTAEKEIKTLFQVLVECKDEEQQEKAYELLKKHHFECRIISV